MTNTNKISKWSVAHFPIGTIVTICDDVRLTSKIDDTLHYKVLSVRKFYPTYYILDLEPDQSMKITPRLSINIDFVKSIVKRGTGKTYSPEPFLYRQAVMNEYNYFCESSQVSGKGSIVMKTSLAMAIAEPFIKDNMIVDQNKLVKCLISQGVFRQNDQGHYLFTTTVYNKKKAKTAVKRLLNKCLIRHKQAKKDDEALQLSVMERGFDNDYNTDYQGHVRDLDFLAYKQN